MKVLFLSNYLSHHQKPLSDELYKILGAGNYFFVCTDRISNARKEMGWSYLDAPYSIEYGAQTSGLIEGMICSFDVVIVGHAPLSLIKQRIKERKLTICNTERRYKSISRYLKYPINTYKSYYFNRGYLLASSAYAPIDYVISGMRLKKCFRWGYFPEVKRYEDIDSVIRNKGKTDCPGNPISILWAGRLIKWKHPELALTLAKYLRDHRIPFKGMAFLKIPFVLSPRN